MVDDSSLSRSDSHQLSGQSLQNDDFIRTALIAVLAQLDGTIRSSAECSASTSLATVLTSQEREVAIAAACGSQNREIASKLFASVKTIEHHLSRVYQKLSVTSRSEFAALIIRELARPCVTASEADHPDQLSRRLRAAG